jgi:hypothetical protein
MDAKKLGECIDKIKWNTPQYDFTKDLPIESGNHYKIVVVGDGAVGMFFTLFITSPCHLQTASYTSY